MGIQAGLGWNAKVGEVAHLGVVVLPDDLRAIPLLLAISFFFRDLSYQLVLCLDINREVGGLWGLLCTIWGRQQLGCTACH